MSTDIEQTLVRRYFEEVLTTRNTDLVDELFSPDYVYHYADTPVGLPSGLEGFKQFVTHFLSGYPDMRFSVDDQTVEGDKVITHFTARSSAPTGGVMTMPANPEAVAASDTITGTSTDRIVNGKIVESWLEVRIPNPLPQLEELSGEGEKQ
jgi:predicted ester cyclase